MERIIIITVLLVALSISAHAGNWVKYHSTSMKFPAGEKVIPGYSESFYDTDSLRYFDSSSVEIWLKHVTVIGDLVPHTAKELIRINCLKNLFQSLVENTDNQSKPIEIINGEIGGDSSYRIIKEKYCGVPRLPGG
jgi:hypothetical protein